MTALVPSREDSFLRWSVPNIAEQFGMLPLSYYIDSPEDFLPELIEAYEAFEYLDRSAKNSVKCACPLEIIRECLKFDFFISIRTQLENQQSANEEDAALVIKVLLTTLPLNNNIDPQALAEVFMEVCRELQPSKLALHFARISLRNRLTFAPTGKEFRDTLLQAIRSIRSLNTRVKSLSDFERKCALEEKVPASSEESILAIIHSSD